MPQRINWDALLDMLSGGLYLIQAEEVLLVWEGAAAVERTQPRIFADFSYLLADLIPRVGRDGVRLEVLVQLDDPALFNALPQIPPTDFDGWRARNPLPPPRGQS